MLVNDVNNLTTAEFIYKLIEDSVNMRASDIHIEPSSKNIRIRFRIDGELREIINISLDKLSPIITRIKVIGGMDISERRIAQDGRLEVTLGGKEIDMRISTMPTVYGEKIVIRILDRERFLYSKNQLGFSEENLKIFEKFTRQPMGMILVTGPTGSGKTTTLYTLLNELNTIDKNIITIEDPVEYKIDGINQTQVHPKAGLTFSSGLRSILRQDPDIIMIGEIRDLDTGDIALKAAITGHLVLSTLHTNDSPSSIIRLLDMGIEPYMINSAIRGIISQRLVKILCPFCKKFHKATNDEVSFINTYVEYKKTHIYKAGGCEYCNNGYYGRRPIHEIMIMDEEIRQVVNKNLKLDEIRQIAKKNGMKSLLFNGLQLVLDGTTSLSEIIKVAYTIDE